MTLDMDPTKAQNIQAHLSAAGFRFKEVKNAFWRADKKSTTATFYNSGKFVIQGVHSDELASWLIRKGLFAPPRTARKGDRIGTDEAGKGDYFGPLVTAAVLVRSATENQLLSMGVRDSKSLSDRSVRGLASQIKTLCPHAVISIGPKRYNELHLKLKSVNRVLGWAHARAIENILEHQSCGTAISDQFGDEKYIEDSLMRYGKSINLIQMPRAEADVAVAGASILARDGFLEWLNSATQKFAFRFPKGASSEVIASAKAFVREFGSSRLGEVAKLHFRTTEEVLWRGES